MSFYIVILVRHDYPNNSSILGELYNTWVLAHMLATFMFVYVYYIVIISKKWGFEKQIRVFRRKNGLIKLLKLQPSGKFRYQHMS